MATETKMNCNDVGKLFQDWRFLYFVFFALFFCLENKVGRFSVHPF